MSLLDDFMKDAHAAIKRRDTMAEKAAEFFDIIVEEEIKKGDLNAGVIGLFYQQMAVYCLTYVRLLLKETGAPDDLLSESIDYCVKRAIKLSENDKINIKDLH